MLLPQNLKSTKHLKLFKPANIIPIITGERGVLSDMRKWIYIPLALVCIFMIYWGIWGTEMHKIEPVLQSRTTTTGTVSGLDAQNGKLTLNVDDKGKTSVWEVSFNPEKLKLFYIDRKTENGKEIEKRIQVLYTEKSELLKDGITITATGEKKDGKIKSSVFHIGGIYNPPELVQKKENVTIYNTADKLCIACVGLGDSDLTRLLQIGIIFIGIMIIYAAVSYVTRRAA